MNFYAQPRMTRDIDLVVAIGLNEVSRIVTIFEAEYYVSREAIRESVQHESLFNLVHFESSIKVDCIVRKTTPYRINEFARRQKMAIEDFSTWIASKEDLMISKLHWAKDSESEMQMRDVRNLASTGFDAAYMAHWTEALGLASLWKTCQP
jgi:hypothetical protein